MKKYGSLTNKVFLGLLILFSFFMVSVHAEDYELLIITPKKFESTAKLFLQMHNNAPDIGHIPSMNGCYAVVEEIISAYDNKPDGVEEPSPAEEPPVPATPENYPPEGVEPVPNLCIIKFLRGVLKYDSEHETWNAWGWDYRYAIDLLRNSDGDGYDDGFYVYTAEAKFTYLLLLGDTGAAGLSMSYTGGVPESWWVWMDETVYDQNPDADNTIFPTDFFYASPDYNKNDLDWIPDLKVGRIPIYDLGGANDSGTVKEITTIGATDETYIPGYYDIDQCDVCDSDKSWGLGSIWTGSELWIVSDGNPSPENGGTGEDAPIGATYLILRNTDTCLRVLGDPSAANVEAEDLESDPPVDGDGYEIHDDGSSELFDVYTKCNDYLTAVATSGAWDDWVRKVVTVGGDWGDFYPTLFAFWDEFVISKTINNGYFEGNEIVKLRHTNKDDGDATNNFTVTSLEPYLNDNDCGLLFHRGYGTDTALVFDDGIIDRDDVLGYVSSDTEIPIMISNSDYNARFERTSPSFGSASVMSPNGGAIAYIGATDYAYTGIAPAFSSGVLSQSRLYNFDELLDYTARSFHSAPRYIGDLFAGSPSYYSPGLDDSDTAIIGPVHDFVANNDMEYWANQKTVWTYELFGDPALPIPYPQTTAIETATLPPDLAFDANSLRALAKGRYESHGIGVDEIPTVPGFTDTTVDITARDDADPARTTVPGVKITRIDIRRDTADPTWYTQPSPVPASYTFTTPDTEPGYYFVKVEQPGWDPNTSSWSGWWEKERWIYVQEVNQFVPTTTNILVVDDDYGYPVVSYNIFNIRNWTYGVSGTFTKGYEDWYLRALDDTPSAGAYDVWHVDYDDSDVDYSGSVGFNNFAEDGWLGADQGDLLMNGEIYQSILNSYDKVIWLTGDCWGYEKPVPFPTTYPYSNATWNIETLTSPEQACLRTYLGISGKGLFLSGQGIIADFTNCISLGLGYFGYCEWLTLQPGNFLFDILRLTNVYTSMGYEFPTTIQRVSTDTVTLPGLGNLDIAGSTGAQNQIFFADAEPSADTPIVSRIFEYQFGPRPPFSGGYIGTAPFIGTAGTAYYRGVGANVFLPWGFEAIDNPVQRGQLMGMILSWLDNPTRTGEGTEPGAPDDEDGEGGGGPGSLPGCFIATACYGTPMAKEVQMLSSFRDKYLLNNSLGRIFVENYYKFSPRISEYISKHPILKKFMRAGLKPLVRLCEKLVEK